MNSSAINWDDMVLPFQLDKSDIRGRVARLDGVLNGVLKQHNYPDTVEALVAEMALLTAIIGESIKLRWKLSLQIQSKGAVRMIATDYYGPSKKGEPAKIRAYASFDESRLSTGPYFEQLGEGYFAILIDQGEGMKPYKGIPPLSGGSIAACAEAYFAQSEQLPTRFKLSFGKSTEKDRKEHWRAGGIMIQHMPKSSIEVSGDGGSGEDGLMVASDLLTGDDNDYWYRANILLDTVEEIEMTGPVVGPKNLLVRLFHEESPRAFEPQKVEFGCTCSEERVRQSLSIYSAKDLEKMTPPEGRVTADCQFCGAHYDLSPETVGFQANKNGKS